MAVAKRYDDLKLHLQVLGEEHEISARAQLGPTAVLELLPLARAISDGVTAIALDHVRSEGEAVACKPGCAACCRHLIPVAPAEAARLAQVVEAMPGERRRAVKKRFEEAVKRMEEAGLIDARAPRGRSALLSGAASPSERWEDVSHRYFALRVQCPFLVDEACSIYAERPMTCREYHVTTPPELCSTLDPALRATPRPVRMSEVMVRLTNALLGRADLAVPLVLSLEWAGAHRRAFDRRADGEELAMALVQHIQEADDAEGAGS